MKANSSPRTGRSDDPVVVNVIGAGRWGPNVARAFDTLPDATIHYVCDANEASLTRIRGNMAGVEITTDVATAIEDPTACAIAIATPVHTHFQLAKAALEAGKHVLVEKPLCADVDECLELMELAEELGLVLAVGHVFLFNAGIQKVKAYIDSGELGKVQYIHATRTNLGPIRSDVNAAWDLAAHDLSIFDYWLDAAPVSVNAHGQCFLGGSQEDVVVSAYRYPNDVLGFMHVSWLNPKKVREITIVGDQKMIVWNDIDLVEPVRVYDKSASTESHPPYADSFGAQRAIIRDGDVLVPKVTGPEPLRAECAHFVDCVRTGRHPINHARMAVRIVGALAATQCSIEREGAVVPITMCDAPHHAVPTVPVLSGASR